MFSKIFDLTFTQQEIYLDQIKKTRNPLYNVGGYIKFRKIDLTRLQHAHRRLIEEFEIFGMRINVVDGRIVQRLDGDRDAALEILDFSNDPRPEETADRWLSDLFEKPFQLNDTSLYKSYALKISEFEFRYVGLSHHILMDGFGFSNWAALICDLYNDPEKDVLDHFSIHELVADEVDYVASSRYEKDRSYWISELGGALCTPIAPRHRSAMSSETDGRSCRKIADFARQNMDRLKLIAADLQVSVAHLLLAVLAIQFSRSVSRPGLIIGVPFHNRRGGRQRNSLGTFVSMSPLYLDLADSSLSLEGVISNVSNAQIRSLRHQRYPIRDIVKDIGAMASRQPLYDVGFNYLKLGTDLHVDGEAVNLVYLSHNHEPLPLMVTLCEYGDTDRIELQLDYNLAYFNESELDLIVNRFKHLLALVPGELHTPLNDLVALPIHEKQRLLKGFGDNDLSNQSKECIHQLFELQARKSPHAIAIESSERSYSYQELDEVANGFARFLQDNGVTSGSLVGLSVSRSALMIAAILGIFKAGAAYVPLDPTYPKKRIQDIVLDSGLRYVLTEDHLVQHFSELDLDLLSLKKAETFAQSMKFERFEAIADSDTESVAYVIYTSGSTGRPKGVQICHTSTVAFLHWAATVFSSRELQKVLFSTSINFDLSIFEMFGPLSTGGCCVVVENILQLLEQHPSISMINTVPSAMRTLLERDALPAGVEVINLAGEPLSAKIVNDLLERGLCKRVLNLYGPTEDTTYSSYAVFDAPIKVAPHIGRAIAGTLFFVLGEHGQLLPWGAIGELYIGGRGLAKGYLNNPDLTSQKFIDATNFGMPGVRLYRTGDLVRYDWSGDLEYLGRNDEQVKIRGFRIELGEVQRCFESGVEVESAAVIVRELQQELFLAAFVVRSPTGNDLAARESDDEWLRQLRHFVDKSLPKYMAPSFLTTLKELPLTANGKVDKRALMKLEPVLFEGIEMIGPESDTEEKLVGLVGALLGQDAGKIGVTASLFELGGHSLILVRLANQVQLELGVSLPMDEYFQASHIRDMGRRIDEQAAFQNVSKMAQDAALISSGYL